MPDPSSTARVGFVLGSLRAVGGPISRLPQLLWAFVAAAWFGWIAHLSSGPIDLETPLPFGAFLTNLGHAPLFGLAALWVCAAFDRRTEPFRWPRLAGARGVAAVALVSLYGALDEWHQSMVPERSACWLDFVTDTVAAICVVVTVHAAGSPRTGEARIRGVLAGCVLACCAAAGAATLYCP